MHNEIYAEVLSRGQAMRGMVHRPVDFSAARRFPAIIICHGFTGTRVEGHRVFVKTARTLAAQGFVVARFDFIGSGDSDGDFVDATPETEIDDALQIIDWLRSQPGVDRTHIGMIGTSLGGLVTAIASSRSGHVHAICLWAATAHMGKRMEERTSGERAEHMREHGWFDHGGLRVDAAFIESAQRVKPLQEASRYDGKVLLIHGSKDDVVPVSEVHEYANAYSKCNPRVHIIEGADHGFNRVPWESELIETTSKWFKESLCS
jgi:dipeptidyl aminopeptidase/acylaminoacyl peptidase